MEKKINISYSVIVIVLFLMITFIISRSNFLLFHSLVEGVSIFISLMVFIIAWNSKEFAKNNYLLVLGTAYLFVGILDFLHMLSYKGISIFTEYDYYANQLWIASRYFESIVILLVVLMIGSRKEVNTIKLIFLYSIITTIIVMSIFFWNIFPICFIEGQGQTTFKIVSEYIIIMLLFAAMIIMIRKKHRLHESVLKFIILSIIMTILSELAFALYTDIYGITNFLGHNLKIASFYCIYQAIVVTGIKEPYSIIFKELNDNNIEMKRLNVLLEKTVEEADNANKTKSKYLSIMSHEMRTPVNGITGFAQLLKRTELDSEQIEYTEMIHTSSKYLRDLIDNILDIEKFLSGNMPYFKQKIILKDAIDNIAKTHSLMCKEKSLDFNYENKIDQHLTVEIDINKLNQVINNFLGNAIKFTKEGSVTFVTRTEEIDNLIEILIIITDTGIGIEKKEQDNLFKPFVQLNKTNEQKYGGSGLGLSISKEIVDHYQGSIHVESEVGIGSKFVVKLKVNKV